MGEETKMIKLKELLLKEYVDTDVVKLWKYLDSTPDQKVEEIINTIGYERLKIIYGADKSGGNPYGEKEIKKWLYDSVKTTESAAKFFKRAGIPPRDMPSWIYLTEPKLLKNQWLVHGTNIDDGTKMARGGFIKGIADSTKLGLTTWLEEEKIGEGYNFAYTPEDFANYGMRGEPMTYGDGTFLVFRASGIRSWHINDDEYQTIFNGKTARDIVLVHEMMGTYTIYSKNGKPLVQTNMEGKSEPTDIVDWVVNNYDQYRKSIGWEKPR